MKTVQRLIQGIISLIMLSLLTTANLADGPPGELALHPLESQLNLDGTLDLNSVWTGSLDTPGWQMTTDPNGDLSLTSAFQSQAAASCQTDGSEIWDTAYGSRFRGVYAIAVDGDKVVVGGIDQTFQDIVAMWNGQNWTVLGEFNDNVETIAINGDDIYIGGRFSQVSSTAAQRIAKWNQTTGTWSALGSGMDKTVYALAISNGILYAGGAFTTAGNDGDAHLVAWWDGTQWHHFNPTAEFSGVFEHVRALAVDGNNVFIGGAFSDLKIGGNSNLVLNIVLWDRATGTWFRLGSGVNNTVRALTMIGNNLYVGGSFTTAGGGAASKIARWNNTTGWSSLSSGLGGTDLQVSALNANGTNLYVGGKFTTAGPTLANNVARWDTLTEIWSPLGSGIKREDFFTEVRTLASTGNDLYVGGNFDFAGGQPVSSDFARWGPPPPPSTSVLVTQAAGGTLTTGDGFSITFPPNAVSENVYISYQGLLAPTFGLPVDKGAFRSFTLEARTDSFPFFLTTFSQSYTLQLDYTETGLASCAVKEADLNLVYLDLNLLGATWLEMLPCDGCNADTAANRITIVADHFTQFAFVGKQEKVYLPLIMR